jgi:hypothetical protein
MKKPFLLVGMVISLVAACALSEEQKSAPPETAGVQSPELPAAAVDHETLITKDYVLQGAGTLHLAALKAWRDASKEVIPADRKVKLIEFKPASGNDFAIVVEALNLGEDKAKEVDIKRVLTAAGLNELPSAVEKTLDIKDFKGVQAAGSYFTITDKHLTLAIPQPGEYKYLTKGYARLDGLILTFRVVSNRVNGEEKKAGLEMIKTARFSPGK